MRLSGVPSHAANGDCTLMKYLSTSCRTFCLLHYAWQVFNRRIGPQQIIESPTDVNQIFIDNKVKDCLVCTTTSLIPAQKSALSHFILRLAEWRFYIRFRPGAVGFSRANDQFQRAATVSTYDGFSFCAVLVTAFAARSPAIGRPW